MRVIDEIYQKGLLFDSHYKLIRPLSTEGGSADVWLAIDINTIEDPTQESQATKVAIKIYRPKNMIDIEGENQFRTEFKKVFGCHHENIIQPTYFNIFQGMPYLVFPYCSAGSSEKLVGRLEKEDDIWKYIYEVSSGLAYLHEHQPQIIHQDIKPANVLIDENGNFAITDFGISTTMEMYEDGNEDGSVGTVAFMAPERFVEGTPPMPQSDIWGLGATVYELITGDAPFGNDGGQLQKKSTPIPSIQKKIPQPIKDLIYSCLAYDIKDRPTARDIVDIVLKKRYNRNKKAIIIGSIIAIAVIAIINIFFALRNRTNQENHLNTLLARGDSIVNLQSVIISSGNSFNTSQSIAEFEKALVLYGNVNKDASEKWPQRGKIENKIELTKQIISEIKEFDRASDLAEKAQITEMEEEYVIFSIEKDNRLASINQLIQKLK